jgi:hypothetical protein
MLTKVTQLVLVVGCPRSGTTWLGQLLLAHPAATGVEEGETSLFLCLQDLSANMARRDGQGLSGYLDAQTVDVAVRRFCDRLIGDAVRARDPHATVFIEKTPAHAYQLHRIARLYPDVRVIHIVRDGRDVARSLAELSFGAPNVRFGAETWTRVLTAVRRQEAGLRHFREVQYEQLLSDPVAGICDLYEWLGLAVDADVHARVAERAGRRVSQFDTSGPVGAGKWRSLPRRELSDIYLVAGQLLVDRGYLGRGELAHWSRSWSAQRARARRATRRLGTRLGVLAEETRARRVVAAPGEPQTG